MNIYGFCAFLFTNSFDSITSVIPKEGKEEIEKRDYLWGFPKAKIPTDFGYYLKQTFHYNKRYITL